MSAADWSIIAIYLLAVVRLGVTAGIRRGKSEIGGEGGHYFLAGNTLTWPIIGLAMFAANISTVHLVSLAEAAYKFGLVFGNFEWMAGFTLVLLSLFFAPLYLRSRVSTLPDFLERRFNGGCRDVLSIVSLFSAIVIHMGVALYTAAWELRGILGLKPGATIMGIDALILFIVVLGLLTGRAVQSHCPGSRNRISGTHSTSAATFSFPCPRGGRGLSHAGRRWSELRIKVGITG